MRWHDLLFLHHPVPPSALRPLVPPSLELDTFDGRAWIGIVPFHMTGVRPTFLPPAAAMAFPEINVRTYVRRHGREGVWFFSLDAASRVAVRAARLWFGLPYFDARMSVETESPENRRGDGSHRSDAPDRGAPAAGGKPAGEGRLRDRDDGAGAPTVRYRSVRTHRGAPAAAFEAVYRATGPVRPARPGSLAHWLTERYRLYASDRRGRLRHGDIHHGPWPLRPAEAEVRRNTMADPLGLAPGAPRGAPVLHFAGRLDVVAWGPQRDATGPPSEEGNRRADDT